MKFLFVCLLFECFVNIERESVELGESGEREDLGGLREGE